MKTGKKLQVLRLSEVAWQVTVGKKTYVLGKGLNNQWGMTLVDMAGKMQPWKIETYFCTLEEGLAWISGC